MFRRQDLLLLLITFSSMAAGVFVPQWAEPLRYAPMGFVMFLLFLSFLSIDLGRLVGHARQAPWPTVRLLVAKLVALPLISWLLFRLFWPRYALAALIMGGASSAVLSPFMAALLAADVVLTAAVVILSSLALPFTLPPLVALLSGQVMEVDLAAMIRMLAMMIFIPALMGRAGARWLPGPTSWLSGRTLPLSMLSIAVTNVGVFSRYSGYFRDNPGLALEAWLAGCLLTAVIMALGLLVFRRQAPPFRTTAMVCTVFPNYILILAFSSQFFGPVEATFAATYSIPFFLQLLPLRKFLTVE